MKTCKANNCNNPVFSHLFCRLHQWMRTDDDYKKYKELKRSGVIPKKTKIKPESEKRKKDNRRYRERLEDRWKDSVENKTNICLFCGEFMTRREDNHHVTGRGVTILNEELWAWCHRTCHDRYHHDSVENLMKEPWWESFLIRVKAYDISQYYKELKKIEKSEE